MRDRTIVGPTRCSGWVARLAAGGALVVVFATGCGRGAAAEDCDRLVDTLCKRLTACGVKTQNPCATVVEGLFPGGTTCDNAEQLRDRTEFEVCIKQIESTSCATIRGGGTIANTRECRGQIGMVP